MNLQKRVFLFSLATALSASFACASGFKIPEQSGDSVAMAASNVATSFSADAAYYNPANMVFMPVNHEFAFSAQYMRLGKLDYHNKSTTFGNANYDTSSKVGNFFVPGIHFISPFVGDRTRFGFSLAVPAGMTMKWSDPFPKSIAEHFEIQVIELAPSVAYMLSDQLSVAFGLRAAYTSGKVKNEVSNATISAQIPGVGSQSGSLSARRELEGDSWDFGYNVALSYRPTQNLSFAATYRSKINLTVEGDADIRSNLNVANAAALISAYPQLAPMLAQIKAGYDGEYHGDVSIDIPLPAILTLGASYQWNDWTFTFAYDRTFWHALKEFDFEYSRQVPVSAMFDKPVEKDWHDTDTFRFGVAYQYDKDLRLMGGFAIDEPAADANKVRFELPDTKSYIYSLGANYKFSDSFDLTGAALYQDRQAREINSPDSIAFNNLVGEFGRTNILILNLTASYKF
ncbi:MAG: outer membrane protein transport protein [Campylobacter sp.]|nr:outer membrane protein transport protein [Campylobacter sp.]